MGNISVGAGGGLGGIQGVLGRENERPGVLLGVSGEGLGMQDAMRSDLPPLPRVSTLLTVISGEGGRILSPP